MAKKEQIEIIADMLHEKNCPSSGDCVCGYDEGYWQMKAKRQLEEAEITFTNPFDTLVRILSGN